MVDEASLRHYMLSYCSNFNMVDVSMIILHKRIDRIGSGYGRTNVALLYISLLCKVAK